MIDYVWVIPLLPLVGFVLLTFFGKRIGEPGAGFLATLMTAGSFAVAVGVFVDLLGRPAEERRVTYHVFDWLSVGGFKVDAAMLVDPLSVTMILFVTGIGSLIHLYAIGYMHGDERFPKFFVYLNLFVFSMLCLVLGDSFLTMFLGWEGVGACSYLLISFWFERETAAVAGKKAFVTNRVGDLGLMIAMFLTFGATGSLTYVTVFEKAEGHSIARVTATAICLLLFVGACGKSAQLPLFVWLPDAMEGPTPVSALIHAATMVTAGVYLMVRVHPIFEIANPDALKVVAWVGVLTAFFAATVAIAQDDIKRVLAYSTISQLGYMFLAVGVKANVAAVFHMVTHAFFKALLFLAAGSVIHGMHDEQNMKRMGNLRRFMPITAGTFIIGWAAIAGLPPFAGFWSKDDILAAAWAENKALWAIGLVTALMTAYYMTRQVILVFFGKERFLHAGHVDFATPDEKGHTPHAVQPHESPWLMLLPLVALAGLSLVGGAINLPFSHRLEALARWLEPAVGEHELGLSGGTKVVLAVVAVVAGLLGIFFAYNIWWRGRADQQRAVEPELLRGAYGVDRAYGTVFGVGGGAAATLLATQVDKKGIDGVVNGIAAATKGAATQLRKLQTGYVRNYAVGIIGGTVLLLGYVIVRVGIQ